MSEIVGSVQDWAILRSAAQEMQAYLLSDQWAWPVRRDARLTPGTWLLSCRRLRALSDVRSAAERDALIAKAQQERARWMAAWRKKSAEDAEKRLRLWRNYLLEMVDEGHASKAEYAAQVQHRVMLTLLDEDGALDVGLRHLCAELDTLLRMSGGLGGFVWPTMYAAEFDREMFWYLYYSL
jgi:hypothetical protein